MIWPHVATFPQVRTGGPDLTYPWRPAGPGALAPAEAGVRVSVVSTPGLELRCLAACLTNGFQYDGLAARIRELGVEGSAWNSPT